MRAAWLALCMVAAGFLLGYTAGRTAPDELPEVPSLALQPGHVLVSFALTCLIFDLMVLKAVLGG